MYHFSATLRHSREVGIMPVIDVSLEHTELYKRLETLAAETHHLAGLPGNVRDICRDAANRLKEFAVQHPQFTLHDETHCVRVVVLMGHVLGPTLSQLNAVEIALLVLAAFFHDQGMVIDASELESLRGTEDWQVFQDNWIVAHPNRSTLLDHLQHSMLSNAKRAELIARVADLDRAMLTDYLRISHGERSALHVGQQLATDPRTDVQGTSLAAALALVCRSHVYAARDIRPDNGFHFDELIGTWRVNLGVVAYTLRLADILDFDRDRTPDSLYRAITFTNSISINEWQKHRSITGWDISPDSIAYAASCDHPAYQRAILHFIQSVDLELQECHKWNRLLPAQYQRHAIQLPIKVDTSRIVPRVDLSTNRPIYKYIDLEFSLSRDELIKLLMTDNLYTAKGLFVRELLQNSLDALRFRQALYATAGIPLNELRVQIDHYVDADGYDIVTCVDNGAGMDERIVTEFLTKAGRSYYRSPEFEQERARLRRHSCDFDPCARFGIGFLSCFMFGDEITIHTRRDFGPGTANGEPLIIDISGTSGIIQVRPGTPTQQPGTTVNVRARRKSFTVDVWNDPVWLVEVIEGCALATEYPIRASCKVPGISRTIDVPVSVTARPHPLESIECGTKRVFTRHFSDADPNLRGEVRVCLLTDDSGIVAINNDHAEVRLSEDDNESKAVRLVNGPTQDLAHWTSMSQVCCDGILVAGVPGRGNRGSSRLGHHFCNDGLGLASFVLDARGGLKPLLTAARTPPSRHPFREHHSWYRLFSEAGKAYASLLDDIATNCSDSRDAERFWLVATAYGLRMDMLRIDTVWNHLRLPLASGDGTIRWTKLSDIGQLQFTFEAIEGPAAQRRVRIATEGGSEFVTTSAIDALQGKNGGWLSAAYFAKIAVFCSEIRMNNHDLLSGDIRRPADSRRMIDFTLAHATESNMLAEFGGGLREILSIPGTRFMNGRHPIVNRLIEDQPTSYDDKQVLTKFFSAIDSVPGHWPDLQVSDGSWDHRWKKMTAKLYAAVDWNSVHEEFRPPYRYFVPGKGICQLTQATLESWL